MHVRYVCSLVGKETAARVLVESSTHVLLRPFRNETSPISRDRIEAPGIPTKNRIKIIVSQTLQNNFTEDNNTVL